MVSFNGLDGDSRDCSLSDCCFKCSYSVLQVDCCVDRGVGVKMEVKGGSEKQPVGLFVIVQCPWSGGSWVKVNFEHYGVVVRRKCRDSLRFRYWASFRECYV